jgi:hypothetical protein
MSLVRTILTVLLTGVYLVVCPLLVLYALGYIYNPVRQGFVRTGIVELVTVPSGADVYLEGSRFARTTPTLLEELLPGRYTLTLRKAGYKPWRHTVTVSPGKAVAFKNIVLIPESWPWRTAGTLNCQDIVPMGGRYMFLLQAGPTLSECMVYGRDGQTREVLPLDSPMASWPATGFRCVPDSESFLAWSDSPGSKRDVYVNLEGREPNAMDITDMLGDRPSFVTWSPDDPMRLFAVQKDCIRRVDLTEGSSQPCYLQETRGMGVYGNWLYIVDHNNAIVRMPSDRPHGESLWRDETPAGRLLGGSDFYDIRVRRRGIIFMLGTSGDIVSNITPYRVRAGEVRDIVFNGRSDMFAWWTKTSIGRVDFDRRFDRSMFHERFRSEQVIEGCKDIRQVFWAYKDSHLLYNDGGEIYLLELEPQEPHHVEHIATVKRDTNMYYDAEDRMLYYLDVRSGVLMHVQIIPD